METLLNLQPLEEVRRTLQLQLQPLEDNLVLHSKLGEFSPSVVEEEEPPAHQLLIAPGSTSEPRQPVRLHSTSEELQEEEQQQPAVRPTCSDRRVEPQTNRPPSAPGLLLSSVLEVRPRLEVVEQVEAPCSVSGRGATSPGPPPHRGGSPRLAGPGSEEGRKE